MSREPKARSEWLAPLLVVVAAFAAYARGLQGPFLFDDLTLFQDDGSLAPFAPRTRPVVWLTVALNHALSGSGTWSYHALNVAAHALAGILVLRLTRRVFDSLAHAAPADRSAARPRSAALLVALLWTLHPLQTQAVAYVVQRAETLGALLALAYLLAFLRAAGNPRPWPWYLAAWSALGLGLATKEWVAVTPLVALCLDRVLLERTWRAPWHGRGAFHLISLALLPLFFWLFVAPQLFGSRTAGLTLRDFGPLEYLRTQPGVLLGYLRLTLWPHPLCLDRGWPIAASWSAAALPGAAILGLLLGSAWALFRGRGRTRALGLAGAWFFLFLAPTSSLVPIKDPAVEHRMYLPLAALVALLVWALERVTRAHPKPWRALGLLLLAGAALGTVRRVEDYRSGVRMWRSVVACAPHHARAWINLGEELVRADQIEEALPVLERALELDPASGQAALNLGSALMRSGRTAEAIAPYRRAVQLLDTAKTRRNLANALLLEGQAAEAEVQYRAALARQAEADDHYWLAVALQRQNRLAESVPEFEAFLRERPEHADAHTNLAVSLSQLERRAEALPHFRRAVELAPEALVPRLNLGRCLFSQGDRAGALRELEQAMQTWPTRPEPFLEAARLALEDPPDAARARRWSETALRLGGSRRADVLEVLARAQAASGDSAAARTSLLRALELVPSASEAARRLGQRLERLPE